MNDKEKKQYALDKKSLTPFALFVKYCIRNVASTNQSLDFSWCCRIAQAGYFEYLAASYAARTVPLDEWIADNGNPPSSVMGKIAARADEMQVFVIEPRGPI